MARAQDYQTQEACVGAAQAMKREPAFKTEAELCAAFIAWVGREHADVRCYAEWAGWDILLVYPDGCQIGVQAKLRLNAEVIGQAAPEAWSFHGDHTGPDYRAVLVPEQNPLYGIAVRLGLVAFRSWGDSKRFEPGLASREHWNEGAWLDWNPGKRHELPPVATDAIAGSPCPVTLTPWKLAALDVLAEISVKGTITTKRMREIGLNPSRWLTGFWLMPGDQRGLWVRGERCPKFDEQHPTAYAAALAKARTGTAA